MLLIVALVLALSAGVMFGCTPNIGGPSAVQPEGSREKKAALAPFVGGKQV